MLYYIILYYIILYCIILYYIIFLSGKKSADGHIFENSHCENGDSKFRFIEKTMY